ncbi:Gfo/Idh/MocA family oxidoreductase [bacterium]|nr:Gfo/Idh/MocA family oxidoreductase [bacterium]
MTRRDFLSGMVAAGATLATARLAAAQAVQEATAPAVISSATAAVNSAEELRVAMIGPGSQGRTLLTNTLNIPNVRFVALCDIWDYSLDYASRICQKSDQPVNTYHDYREMLEKEKDLDAVLIATPDFLHAPMTLDCLHAGIHVYCEKEMSNTLEGCRQMVVAARETGKLLQIGHQRRSNPRYFLGEKLLHKDKFLGRVTHAYGQWNRLAMEMYGWPPGREIPADVLKAQGYDTMERFRNWRWYRQFGGGLMADLGSHQVDIFNWYFQCAPSRVTVSGGMDVLQGDREFPDNVMAIYEYDTAWGKVRAYYQVVSTSSFNGYYELFLGTEGTLMISEDPTKGFLFKEVSAPKREWEDEAKKVDSMGKEAIALQVGASRKQGEQKAEAMKEEEDANKPPHQLHLENFFAAVRDPGKVKLNCTAEAAFETAVSVLMVDTAFKNGHSYAFKKEEFKA